MFDIDTFCKRFKFGDIEDIFINIYSYFIIGYLILFSVYEKNFINLELHTQILLSLAISLPVTSVTVIVGYSIKTFVDKEKILEIYRKKYNINKEGEEINKIEEKFNEKENEGFLYSTIAISFISSIRYSIIFSLFYIVKHLKIIEYDSAFDPVIAVIIVVFTLLTMFLIWMTKIIIIIRKIRVTASINQDAQDLSASEIQGR